jgi:hypothetical protein
MEKYLKQNIDNMLDAIYSPSGAHPETTEFSLSSHNIPTSIFFFLSGYTYV